MTNPLEIFDATMTVFGAPGRYVQGPGVLDRIGGFARQLGDDAVLVGDALILPLIGSRVAASCQAAGVGLTVLPLRASWGRERPPRWMRNWALRGPGS